MDEHLTAQLQKAVAEESQAVIRCLVAAERASEDGRFNTAKIMRAAAHTARRLCRGAAARQRRRERRSHPPPPTAPGVDRASSGYSGSFRGQLTPASRCDGKRCGAILMGLPRVWIHC